MAITFVEGQVNLAGTTTPAFTNAVSGNGGAGSDLIIAFGIGSSGWTTTGFTDNINTGGYTLLYGTGGYTGSNYGVFQIGYKICNASGGAGTLAVTVTGTNAQRLQAMHFNGFTNTAQFPATDFARNFSNTSGSAVSTGTFTTSFANEYIAAWVTDNSGFSNPLSGLWNSPAGCPEGSQLNFAALNANLVAQGTVCSVSVTANDATNPWVAQCFGFYDGTGVVTPPSVPARGPMPRRVFILP